MAAVDLPNYKPNQKTKRILLWTTPRSLSTAFQLSVTTLPHVKSLLEPYSAPYHRSKPLKVMPNSPLNHSFEDVEKMIQAEYEGKTAVFVKDFACRLRGRFEVFLDERFRNVTHSFLIRNPQRVVLSLYKALNYNLDSFMELYERGDVGIVSLCEFYFFLKSQLGINPIIIDADDLLTNPDQMMEAYCNTVGLEYNEGMTHWEPWPQPGSGWHELKDQGFFSEFNASGGPWVTNAITSSGFAEVSPLPPLPDDLPIEVKKCIEEGFVAYDKLYMLRMTV